MDGVVARAGGDPEASTPLLALGGFRGPLERLLALARAQQIDLSQISLPDLCDQLGAALAGAGGMVPLGQQCDWVVMGAWLLQLRSRLLLPPDAPARPAADAEATQLRTRLAGLEEMRALAAWLERRPQLGRDVLARGCPELIGLSLGTEHEADVIEFLWASLALFDADLPAPETAPSYRPEWLDLHSIADACDRIRRWLVATSDWQSLDQLLPMPAPEVPPPGDLRRRSAWTSTFVASLELARQGELALEQEAAFAPIQVRAASGKGLSPAA